MFYHQHGQTTKSSNKSLQKRQQTTYRPAPQANTTHPAALIQRAKLTPNSLNADDVLTLQGTIGNRAVNRLLASQSATQVQAKLTIGEPGDKYEQEADRVASQVVEQLHAPASAESAQGQSVQRQDIDDDELQAKHEMKALQRQDIDDEELQAKPSISHLQRVPLSPEVQREAMLEDDDLQAKSNLQRQEAIDGGDASTDLESAINRARGSGQPLDAGLQQSMGQAMGADFSGVKVHTDAQSDQLNQSIQARAFTTGQNMFFRQGEYNPGSRGGQELIAHELTHVVQQNAQQPIRHGYGREKPDDARVQRSRTRPNAGLPRLAQIQNQFIHYRYGGLVPTLVPNETRGSSAEYGVYPGLCSHRSTPNPAIMQDTISYLNVLLPTANNWIRGHLFNDQLGGSGQDVENLVPMTHTTNVNWHNAYEKPMKDITIALNSIYTNNTNTRYFMMLGYEASAVGQYPQALALPPNNNQIISIDVPDQIVGVWSDGAYDRQTSQVEWHNQLVLDAAEQEIDNLPQWNTIATAKQRMGQNGVVVNQQH